MSVSGSAVFSTSTAYDYIIETTMSGGVTPFPKDSSSIGPNGT